MATHHKEFQASLDCLPQHILIYILHNVDDLRQCRLVSKNFRDASNLAILHLKPSSQIPKSLLQTFPRIESLDISNISNPTIISTTLPIHLTSLKLGRSFSMTPIRGAGGTSFITSLGRTLKELSIFYNNDVDNRSLSRLSSLSHLTSLSLNACANVADRAFCSILPSMSHLENIDVGGCYKLGDSSLTALGALPKLKNLNLGMCDSFTNAGFAALCKSASLRTLLLPACWQIDDNMLCTLSSSLTSLECLSLFEAGETVTDSGMMYLSSLIHLTALDLGYSCWEHTQEGLSRCINALASSHNEHTIDNNNNAEERDNKKPTKSKLQVLNLGGTGGMCDAVVHELTALQSLTSLDVSECQKTTSSGLQELACLPHLVEINLGWNLRLADAAVASLPEKISILDLSYCRDVTDQALSCIAGSLPRITVLKLRRCVKITDAGIAYLAAPPAAAAIDSEGSTVPISSALPITQLDLAYTAVTSFGLDKHVSKLSSLSSLNIDGCLRAGTVIGLASLASMPSLSSLDMSNNPRLDDGCMQSISFSKNLSHLTLRNCPRVGDYGLLALCRTRRLTHLNIEGCLAVTPSSVEQLEKKLPLLNKVKMAWMESKQYAPMNSGVPITVDAYHRFAGAGNRLPRSVVMS